MKRSPGDLDHDGHRAVGAVSMGFAPRIDGPDACHIELGGWTPHSEPATYGGSAAPHRSHGLVTVTAMAEAAPDPAPPVQTRLSLVYDAPGKTLRALALRKTGSMQRIVALNAATGARPPKKPGLITPSMASVIGTSAYYAFSLEEIEHRIEAPSGEIDAMRLELVGNAVDDDNYCAD
jgi:hypothetical protein